MHPACALKSRLSCPQSFRKTVQKRALDPELCVNWRQNAHDLINRPSATEAATRIRENIPTMFIRVERSGIPEHDVRHCAAASLVGPGTQHDICDGLSRARDTFTQGPTSSQFPVVSGGPHRHGDHLALNSDFKGFLCRHLIRAGDRLGVAIKPINLDWL